MARKNSEQFSYLYKRNHDLILLCHPFLFALKEGQGITKNCLDYSLLLMQRNCAEIIKSPKTQTHGVTLVDSTPIIVKGISRQT